MLYIDEIEIELNAGDGGDGAVSWRKEKFVPKGGPDGGDGGSGGAIIFVATEGKNSLNDYAFTRHLKAEEGRPGEGNQRTGKDGQDLINEVPVGTQFFFKDKLVADLSIAGAKWIAAKGGRGGKGNINFKSSTNQAPEKFIPGSPGDKLKLKLVLKSIADIGLVGFPNVGKSTLIKSISNSKAEVANYEFTTLSPNLGVVLIGKEKRFVIADIPGIISGASKGKGLGISFLKHVERTKALAFIIDPSKECDEDCSAEKVEEVALKQYKTLSNELFDFSEELSKKKSVVLFSKCDLPQNKLSYDLCKPYFSSIGLETLEFSSISKDNLENLKILLSRLC